MPERLGTAPSALLSFFGVGCSPIAPGTVASVVTALLVHAVALRAPEHALVACGGLIAFGCIATLAWGGLPTSASGKGDPGWVVADEVAGQALASVPAVLAGGWQAHLLALALFRVFDILKPPPVKQAEALPGGVGVLLDDVVAGALAAALTYGAWQAGLFAHLA
ncbi:MAG: phosphatidylglycerophosphatase A [Planctomycetota bacterium]|nr:phosphatidylglycerophosphatase A [Planctomycetota bacterium]